jgi:hypothetical protein
MGSQEWCVEFRAQLVSLCDRLLVEVCVVAAASEAAPFVIALYEAHA